MKAQREFVGSGAVDSLPTLITEANARSVFLLHGRSSYRASGLDQRIKNLLPTTRITEWADFSPNPAEEDLERGIEIFRRSECDCLLSVGGGSVMDMAKLLKYFADAPGRPSDYLAEVLSPPSIRAIPHIAVPTTSGSGSEATHFAVLFHNREKYSVAHQMLLPDAALVDPDLTVALPPGQTAVSGMDALAQAIESYWCIYSTDESRAFSAEALQLIRDNLVPAVRHPSPTNRAAMASGAYLSGKAINIAKTTAPHAISYTMTIRHGIPHGHAVAMTLGEIFVHNAGVGTTDCTDPRGAGFVQKRIEELLHLLECRTAADASAWLRTLMESIGLETRLDRVGVRTNGDRQAIVDGVNLQRLKNNPRTLSRNALQAIILRISGEKDGASR